MAKKNINQVGAAGMAALSSASGAAVNAGTPTTLKTGSAGRDVVDLQKKLIAAGYDVGSTGADGVYGTNTANAVKQYQRDHGLAVDGIAGKNTLSMLNNPSVGTGSNNIATGAVSSGLIAAGATPNIQQTADNGAKTLVSGAVGSAQNDAGKKPTAITGTVVGGTTGATQAANKNPTSSGATATNKNEVFTYEPFTYDSFTYDPYSQSDVVQQAHNLLQQHISTRPGEYTSVWQDEADAYLSQYQNRDPFSYDFNSDALYNQYKDQYIQQGRMAMMDTMGQAAALTGGYGNSYAQTVGQQAYNQQLSQLNNIMPELYGMAYDRYNKEGQDLLNMYGLYMDREAQEYGRYQDNLSNWYKEADRLTDNYNTLYEQDYNAWADDTNLKLDNWKTETGIELDEWSKKTGIDHDNYWKNIDMEYQRERDRIEDERYENSHKTGTTGNNGSVSTEDDAYWTKQAKNTGGDVKSLNDLANRMRAAGCSDDYIRAVCSAALGNASGSTAVDTTVQPDNAGMNVVPGVVAGAAAAADDETWWDRFIKGLSGYNLPV